MCSGPTFDYFALVINIAAVSVLPYEKTEAGSEDEEFPRNLAG